MDNNGNLVALLQTLPQELYDRIYESVFSADNGERIVDENYDPPILLRVHRALRELFASTYYGKGATFTFPFGVPPHWTKSLPSHHFDKIQHFEVWIPLSTDPQRSVSIDFGRQMQNRSALSAVLVERGYMSRTMSNDEDDLVDHYWNERGEEFNWTMHADTEARGGWVRMTWTKSTVNSTDFVTEGN